MTHEELVMKVSVYLADARDSDTPTGDLTRAVLDIVYTNLRKGVAPAMVKAWEAGSPLSSSINLSNENSKREWVTEVWRAMLENSPISPTKGST